MGPVQVRIQGERALVFTDRPLMGEPADRPPQQAGLRLMGFREIRVESKRLLGSDLGSFLRRSVVRRELGHAEHVGTCQLGLCGRELGVERHGALEQRSRHRIVLSALVSDANLAL